MTQGITQPAIPVNELYGPTIQGEGLDLGKPCLFLRTHHCPVRCPGCDTHFSWDGSESASNMPVAVVAEWIRKQSAGKRVGLVLTGGEPLLLYKHDAFANMLRQVRKQGYITWLSLETSGFVGAKPILSGTPDHEKLRVFLRAFDTVHLSPKITPCLHGAGWTDEELLTNVFEIAALATTYPPTTLALKFVVRDLADVDAAAVCVARIDPEEELPVYLMPYGQDREEILRACEWLVPVVAERGWTITPRLHSLIWGKERGR